jgi:hypothetical protein
MVLFSVFHRVYLRQPCRRSKLQAVANTPTSFGAPGALLLLRKGFLESLPFEGRQIAWRILRHLSWNVDARDTMEGILNWWLGPDTETWPREQVREVLEFLVSRHLVFARGETVETRVYGLDPAHTPELRQFLAELEREH